MNVSEFFANQERGLAQLAWADDYAQRRLDWENNLLRRHQWLWDMERRAAVLCGPSQIVKTMEAIRTRPFDDLISRMEEQSHGFQSLTDDLNHSAITNAALESMRIGEVYRKLIDPIPELKTILQPPLAPLFSKVFDSTRDLTPLADLSHRIGLLTSNSFAQTAQLGSIIADTFKNISAVVGLAHAPYVENPLFGTESVAGEYFDLNEVVEYGSKNFASPDFGQKMDAILREIQGLRADQAKGKLAKQILLWATFFFFFFFLAFGFAGGAQGGGGGCPPPPPNKKQQHRPPPPP